MDTVKLPGMAYAKKPPVRDDKPWRCTVFFRNQNYIPGTLTDNCDHETTANALIGKLTVRVRENGGKITGWAVHRVPTRG
jgi:hypothetical protein